MSTEPRSIYGYPISEFKPLKVSVPVPLAFALAHRNPSSLDEEMGALRAVLISAFIDQAQEIQKRQPPPRPCWKPKEEDEITELRRRVEALERGEQA